MNKVDKYNAHAHYCMDMAAQAKHAEGKRSWLLLAETWLDMIPDRQRTTAHRFEAIEGTDLRAGNLRVVQ